MKILFSNLDVIQVVSQFNIFFTVSKEMKKPLVIVVYFIYYFCISFSSLHAAGSYLAI